MQRKLMFVRRVMAAKLGVVVLASAATGECVSIDDATWMDAWAGDVWMQGAPGVAGENLSPIVDPKGDAVAAGGMDPPLLDIDTMSVSYTDTDLLVSVTFHTPIEPASLLLPNSLGGFVEFDLDQDPATGVPPVQNMWAPPFDMLVAGIGPRLSLGSEYFHPGFFEVQSLNGPLGQVPAVFGEKSVSAVIPLAMLDDDGLLDFDVAIGTPAQPTDATNVIGTSVPAGCNCLADCNADCELDILDFVCFQDLFTAGDNAADCDGDGDLSVLDFVCFQGDFLAGCP